MCTEVLLLGGGQKLLAGSSKVRIPVGTRDFISETSSRLWDPPTFLLDVYRGPSLGARRQGREVARSTCCLAEDKNEWSRTSVVPICLLGLERGKFALPIITDRELLHTLQAYSCNVCRNILLFCVLL